MKLLLPDKLFGRVYEPPVHPNHARMKTLWKASLPLPPATFDVDAAIGLKFPPRMYLNDTEGDCVLVARANQSTRFIAQQTGVVPVISDDEVQAEYLAETGGPDTGLVPDDSLSLWKSQGWMCAGAHHAIQAWGRIDTADMLDVQRCISLLGGMQLSMSLPIAWQDAIDAGKVWDVPADPSDPRFAPGSWGGHQVWCNSYDTEGVTCWTWGQLQKITWAALRWIGAAENQGEAEAIVRCNDASGAGPADHLDIAMLLGDLQLIEEASA